MSASVNTRRDFLEAAGFSASVLAVSGCMPLREQAPPGPTPKGPPNILWIKCEDVSPFLGCYGDANACPVVQQVEDIRAKSMKADGTPINNNHAMFIDRALMHAIENCRR